MQLKYNNIKTQYGREHANKNHNARRNADLFRTEKVYEHKTKVGYKSELETDYIVRRNPNLFLKLLE